LAQKVNDGYDDNRRIQTYFNEAGVIDYSSRDKGNGCGVNHSYLMPFIHIMYYYILVLFNLIQTGRINIDL